MTDEASIDQTVDELLVLNQRLLESISGGDWATYTELCDPGLTAYEPEARGQLVEGLAFHKFYFDLEQSPSPVNVTMCSPQVMLLGDDTAVVTCIRLTQRLVENQPVTSKCEETRIWQLDGDRWKHVHFHRSAND